MTQSPLRATAGAEGPFKIPIRGQELAIGDALWATAQGQGANRLVFTDPEWGGIQLYAAVVESGLPSMLAARLKVENRQSRYRRNT